MKIEAGPLDVLCSAVPSLVEPNSDVPIGLSALTAGLLNKAYDGGVARFTLVFTGD